MKIRQTLFLLLVLLFSITQGWCQNDYATIVVYRPNNLVGFMTMANVQINAKKVATLKNGGKLEFKLYETGRTQIMSWGMFPEYSLLYTDYNRIETQTIDFNAQKGKTYFFQIKMGPFGLEQTPKILKPKKLKKKKFVTGSDLPTDSTPNSVDLQRTKWTKEQVIAHWVKNDLDPIEGIYQNMGSGLKYELAIIKEAGTYNVIYLSGASGTIWKEGNLKAVLEKTAHFGVFKCDWYLVNGEVGEGKLVTIENGLLKTNSETPSSNQVSTYLKVYPTYDETTINSSSNSTWKGSGTGFFIDGNGYIVTNHHVVKDATTFQVNITKNGQTIPYNAIVVIQDRKIDLALLKIEDSSFQPFTKLNYNFETKTKDVGSSVFALGYPLTSIMGTEIKFTDGKISSKSGFQGDVTTYQISVPIQNGNSGGPLFDENANLVGITSSGLKKDLADNVNYAIKTSYLRLLIDATDDPISLPEDNSIKELPLTEQIKILSEYVVLIRAK